MSNTHDYRLDKLSVGMPKKMGFHFLQVNLIPFYVNFYLQIIKVTLSLMLKKGLLSISKYKAQDPQELDVIILMSL